MNEERLYIITYDITNQRRWRRLFKTMQGYGEWIQLSVFQCRLSKRRRAELECDLRTIVKSGEDHILILDLGSADKVSMAVKSLGKNFDMVEREAVVI